jgi:hypothetical protein
MPTFILSSFPTTAAERNYEDDEDEESTGRNPDNNR